MVYRPQTALLILLAMGLGACTPVLEYPPPAQKVMPTGEEPLAGTGMIVISEMRANTGVVSDVLGADPGNMWRWTNQHPRLRVWVHPSEALNFYVKFTIAGDVLKKVGPQTVRMIVNGQVLDTRTIGTEGEQIFTKRVPPEMLGTNNEVVAGLDIDPVLIASQDGMKLGVLLQEIGLKPAASR